MGCAAESCAYYSIRSNFTPRPILSFALLVKDVFERIVEEFVAHWLWQSSHGFLEWSSEHAAWNMNSRSLCKISSTSTRLWSLGLSSIQNLPWYRPESDKRQIRRKAVQGANCTLHHLTIGLDLHIRILVLFVGWLSHNDIRQQRCIDNVSAIDPSSNVPK
jgi:hypothetical protein